MSRNKRKAFTLTELLVVVVVIGVLAAVVLPKYTKVIETRKTTEAENMMAAVRTEQEHRCALDKPYVSNISKMVDAGVVPSASTQNFYYTLQRDGMRAKHAGQYTYTLRMPSYADGRICCEGRDCNKLNKEYPNCDTLIARADYKEAIDCVPPDAEEPAPTCEELAGEKPVVDAVKDCPCGTVSAPYYCSNGTWVHEDFPACEERPIKDGDCSKGDPGAKLGAVCKDNAWTFEGAEVLEDCPPPYECDPAKKPPVEQACGCQGNGTQTHTVECIKYQDNPMWVEMDDWTECDDPDKDSPDCNLCPSTPLEEQECTPGDTKVDIQKEKRWVEPIGNTGPDTTDVNQSGGGHQIGSGQIELITGHYEWVVTGIFDCKCNTGCKWRCNKRPSHGGGSGGGGTVVLPDGGAAGDIDWGPSMEEVKTELAQTNEHGSYRACEVRSNPNCPWCGNHLHCWDVYY